MRKEVDQIKEESKDENKTDTKSEILKSPSKKAVKNLKT